MTDRRSFPKKVVVIALMAAAGVVGCSGRQPAGSAERAARPAGSGEPLKAAWIYVGPVSDASWTFAHDQGRKAVEAEFGDRVRTTYVENVPEGRDAERVIRELVAQGNRIIFATSFGYGEAMKKVAKDHPHVYFEHVSGLETASNLRVYDARMYEAVYLAGVVAGGMTRTDILGFVATFPIPEVLRNINAYTLGAQSVNPKVKTKVAWIGAWFDPPRETEAAQSLMKAGADVLLQNSDSTAVLLAAAAAGKYAFGWDADMSTYAPKAHLAACALNWSPYYTKAVRDVLDGTWKVEDTRWGIDKGADDLVAVADFVPEEVKQRVRQARDALLADPGAVFKGPLHDNTGREVLARDVVADERWKSGISFYVNGVEGEVPARK